MSWAFRVSFVFCDFKDKSEDCCSKCDIFYSEFVVEIKKKYIIPLGRKLNEPVSICTFFTPCAVNSSYYGIGRVCIEF